MRLPEVKAGLGARALGESTCKYVDTKDKAHKEVCPYCASLLLLGRGLKNTAREAYPEQAEYERALLKVAAYIEPAINVLADACEARTKRLAEKEKQTPKVLN